MSLYDWNTVPLEELNPRVQRKVIHTANLTVARIMLQQYAVIPEHSHPAEQVSMVERGALKFILGGREVIARAGQVVHIPVDLPHSVEALEDSVAVDLFAPRREDWIRGDDAYLRR
jgi:quercetin dioxygenase-like cupin family protein